MSAHDKNPTTVGPDSMGRHPFKGGRVDTIHGTPLDRLTAGSTSTRKRAIGSRTRTPMRAATRTGARAARPPMSRTATSFTRSLQSTCNPATVASRRDRRFSPMGPCITLKTGFSTWAFPRRQVRLRSLATSSRQTRPSRVSVWHPRLSILQWHRSGAPVPRAASAPSTIRAAATRY